MKQIISPIYVALVVVVILGLAGLIYWRVEQKATALPPGDTGGMPPQVSEELRRKLGGVQPPAAR